MPEFLWIEHPDSQQSVVLQPGLAAARPQHRFPGQPTLPPQHHGIASARGVVHQAIRTTDVSITNPPFTNFLGVVVMTISPK